MLKRIVAFLLSMLLIVPVAYADTVTVDLDIATIEELQAARDAIDARLAEILSSTLSSNGDRFTLTGTGTQILEGVDLPYSPARLFVKSDKEIKVTLCSDGGNHTYDGGNSSGYQLAYVIDKQQPISSIIVETQGNWSLEISPIEFVEQLSTSGSGSNVTDAFFAAPPAIVSISFSGGRYLGYTYIYLYKIHSDGSVTSEKWMWQDFMPDGKFDYVIKPEEKINAYFVHIRCPHDTQWEISVK